MTDKQRIKLYKEAARQSHERLLKIIKEKEKLEDRLLKIEHLRVNSPHRRKDEPMPNPDVRGICEKILLKEKYRDCVNDELLNELETAILAVIENKVLEYDALFNPEYADHLKIRCSF